MIGYLPRMTKMNALSKKYVLKYPKMGTRRLSSN
jgi:hypothetical protein